MVLLQDRVWAPADARPPKQKSRPRMPGAARESCALWLGRRYFFLAAFLAGFLPDFLASFLAGFFAGFLAFLLPASSRAACAAASRATGTRNGEQLT